jgi:hypothetical protein
VLIRTMAPGGGTTMVPVWTDELPKIVFCKRCRCHYLDMCRMHALPVVLLK